MLVSSNIALSPTHPTGIAMNNWNRCAPITLPGDQPIGSHGVASKTPASSFLQEMDERGVCLITLHASKHHKYVSLKKYLNLPAASSSLPVWQPIGIIRSTEKIKRSNVQLVKTSGEKTFELGRAQNRRSN